MNYIELINHFWQTRRTTRLTSNEADLYFFLLHESNIRGWENPFECSNKLICATIGITEKTLIDARNRLQQKGFISFEAGQRRKKSPVYTLVDDNINRKPNKTGLVPPSKCSKKRNKKAEPVLPFLSERFVSLWNELTQTPKWRRKTEATLQMALNKLKDFDEEFAIGLIEQAIIGEWQGLVYPDTQSKYENWLKQRSNKANITCHNNETSYAKF